MITLHRLLPLKLVASLVLVVADMNSAQLPTTRLTHPIYVQSTGIPGTTVERVNLIANAGYNGVMWEGSSPELSNLLTALDQRNQKLLGIWRNAGENISADLTVLKDAGDLVFLYMPAGTVTTEAEAAVVVAKIADLLAPSGRKVAIYPHNGDFVSNSAQAVRIAKLANRANAGASFNQCHDLMYCSKNKLNFLQRADSLLKTSMPYIFAASVSGADSVGTGWETLIRPLGEGNFDTFVLVKMLVEYGYHGPFALQAYGLTQNPSTHLANSMQVWKEFQKKLPAIYGCKDPLYVEYNPTVNMPDAGACKTLKTTGLRRENSVRFGALFKNQTISIPASGPYRLTLTDVEGRLRTTQSGFGPKEYLLHGFSNQGVAIIKVETP